MNGPKGSFIGSLLMLQFSGRVVSQGCWYEGIEEEQSSGMISLFTRLELGETGVVFNGRCC